VFYRGRDTFESEVESQRQKQETVVESRLGARRKAMEEADARRREEEETRSRLEALAMAERLEQQRRVDIRERMKEVSVVPVTYKPEEQRAAKVKAAEDEERRRQAAEEAARAATAEAQAREAAREADKAKASAKASKFLGYCAGLAFGRVPRVRHLWAGVLRCVQETSLSTGTRVCSRVLLWLLLPWFSLVVGGGGCQRQPSEALHH
jgi:hypothetical protein